MIFCFVASGSNRAISYMPEHGGPIKHFKTNKRRILSHKTVTEYFNSVSGAPKRYLMGLSVGCGPAAAAATGLGDKRNLSEF